MNKNITRFIKFLKEQHCVVPLFFLGLLFLANCKTDRNENKVAKFSYDQCYKLDNSEKTQKRDSTVLNTYNKWADYGKYQVPLNQVINHELYKVYIGVLMEGSLDGFVDFNKNTQNHRLLKEKENDLGYFLIIKAENQFALRYLFNEKEFDQSIVINFVSSDSSFIHSLYNKSDSLIRSKLKCD